MSGKTKIILFYMNGCPPCNRFREGTLKEFKASDDFKNYDFKEYESNDLVTRDVEVKSFIESFPSLSIISKRVVLPGDDPTVEDMTKGLVAEFDSRATVENLKKYIHKAENPDAKEAEAETELPDVEHTEAPLPEKVVPAVPVVSVDSDLPVDVVHTEADPEKVESRVDADTPVKPVETEKQTGGKCGLPSDDDAMLYKKKYLKYRMKYEQMIKRLNIVKN